MTEWYEKTIPISEIDVLLSNGYEVEVDSPDGWVGVNHFINKGIWDEYVLNIDGFDHISCNENHLFETAIGWCSALELVGKDDINFLTEHGYRKGYVTKTGEKVSIVDINVKHENHRYYTAGVSSHNTGVGKSLFMCHVAAACLNMGKNVLYITLELAEEEVAKRIDANLMNTSFDDLMSMPRDMYMKKADKLKSKTDGKLIVKEYPTANASTLHFKALLNELNLKKSFKPDIIFIDYLNICMSARIKRGNANSYDYVKSIAEEIRGLAVEFEVPVMTATQTTRSGYGNSDVELTDTSECIFVEEKVKTIDGHEKTIESVVPGDQILSQDDFKTVMFVHHKKPKDCVRITLKSGKTIIVSKDHIFPTNRGRLSYNTGLSEGVSLHSK